MTMLIKMKPNKSEIDIYLSLFYLEYYLFYKVQSLINL